MIHIGIDTGVTGAIGALHDGHYRSSADMPITSHNASKWVQGADLAVLLRDCKHTYPCRVTIEATHAMPTSGTRTAHSQGMTLGSVLSILDLLGYPYELVQPSVWKRDLGLDGKGQTATERKKAALSLARREFPEAPLTREGDHNRAEALLIALWAHRNWNR
jgi:hypothetical protein